MTETNGHAEKFDQVLANRLLEAKVNNAEARTTLFRQLSQQAFDPRRDINRECGYPETAAITMERLYDLFKREPVARRVVDYFPKRCWRISPLVYEKESSEAVTPFELSWDALGKSLRGAGYHKQECGSIVYSYLRRLDELAGIGNYGVLLLGFDDGLDLALPVKGVEELNSAPASKDRLQPSINGAYRLTVNAKAARGRKLLYMRPFSQLFAQVVEWESNWSSPRYNQPVMYQVTFGDPNQSLGLSSVSGTARKVHWTRMIHVPSDDLMESDHLGDSRMLTVLNELLCIQKISAADGEAVWKGAFIQIILEMLPEFADVTRDVESLKNTMEAYTNSGQRNIAIEGYTAKAIPPMVIDPNPHIDVHLRMIAVKTGIPKRILEGSERGELSSGQDSEESEADLGGRRNGYCTSYVLAPTIDRLVMVGVLEPPAEDGYICEWPEVDTLNQTEKAQVTLVRTQALTAYVSGGGENLVPPMDYLTRYEHFTEEEATAILDAAAEHMDEVDQADMEKQQTMIDQGLAPDPTAEQKPLPIKMKDGEKLVTPDGKPIPGK